MKKIKKVNSVIDREFWVNPPSTWLK